MRAYEFADLGAVRPDHPSAAVLFVLSHALRGTDADQLSEGGEDAAHRLGELAGLSDRVWVVASDASVPLALLGVRQWTHDADGTPSALLWSVSHPDLEEPLPELLATIGPILSEIAATYPALWAWKLPTDRPEALPRWRDETSGAGTCLALVGPDHAPLSTGWFDHFTSERNPLHLRTS